MTERDETRAARQPGDLPVAVTAATEPGSLPKVVAKPGYEALAGFLQSDLQGGRAGVARLLADLERVERGEVERLERSGNAYRLSLQRGPVLLQPLHDPDQPDCRIDVALLRRTLEVWRAALGPA
ncbi:hypothetical protein [Algihabitans albus]|uniref:hypothetical protein n=1 Tax=Algihabitans albus TaxID=2164067 RepID=UPI000E5D331E|nr:hypothetical protein [Algihabitans albus]